MTAVAGAGGALPAGPGDRGARGGAGTVPVTVLVTVPVTPLVTAGTTLADAAVAGADVAGVGRAGSGAAIRRAGPALRDPGPAVRLWTVWLTLASAPPAGDWPGLPPGAPTVPAPAACWRCRVGRWARAGAAGPARHDVLGDPADGRRCGAGGRSTSGRGAGAGGWRPGRGPGSRRRWPREQPGQERWPRERPERRPRWQRVPGWPVPAGPQNWAGPQRRAGPAAAVLGAGPRRTAPGCRRPVRACCPARGGDSGPRQPPNRPRMRHCPAGPP